MHDLEREKPEEEEYLLPNGAKPGPGVAKSATVNGKPVPGKPSMFKLPWFGSWSTTLLIWVVSTNSLIFWSLPTAGNGAVTGRLSVVKKLWSVNKIYQEDTDLKAKLSQEETKNVELQKGVSGMDEMKQKVSGSESETARLRTQLKDVQSQLDKQREETRKQREDATDQKRRREEAEGELGKLRASAADSSKVAAELNASRDKADRERERERGRAERLAAKLKQLRDAEMPLFKDVESDMKEPAVQT